VRAYPDRGARNVLIKIKDTGCGIPRDELPSLLVPFKQANMSSGRKYGGTGLGLSIAHQLVESHGGSLDIESREGEGTVVSIKLPVLQAETRTSLEQKFKEAYVASGYDYDQLICPDVAKAEGRRNVVFSTSAGMAQSRSSTASARHSMEMDSAVIEQYNWTEHNSGEYEADGNGKSKRRSKDRPPSIEEEDRYGVSAAASGMAGPPPMAVALFSSLYASTGSEKLAKILQAPLGKSMPQLNMDLPGMNASAISRVKSSNPATPAQMSSIEELEMQLLQAQAALEMAQLTEEGHVSPPLPPVASALSEHGPLPPELDAYNKAVANQKEDDDVLEEYAGKWHKAPQFGDDYDDKAKDYYAYDNRMSYEYRPSMDFSPDAWKSPSTPNGKSSKMGSVLKSAVRKSIDMMRFRPSPSLASSSPGGAAASQAKKANALKDKFFGVATVTDSRTSWEVTRKVD
jgi:hypothetical protein